jgi:signal recognition particle receptor subunit beta
MWNIFIGSGMSEYNEQSNKLTIKLVYYGPALSGKTTNLITLHDSIAPELKGEMLTMETKNDRTLFFDLLPLGFTTDSGLLIKIKLFTVPGQVQHDSTRKAVLSRADGVVFVADSQTTQTMNNAAAFENLAHNAARVGLDFEKLPLVIQFNKRDLPHIVDEETVGQRWSQTSWPLHFSSALQGLGVIDTFSTLLGDVYLSLDRRLSLADRHGLDQQGFTERFLGQHAMTGS